MPTKRKCDQEPFIICREVKQFPHDGQYSRWDRVGARAPAARGSFRYGSPVGRKSPQGRRNRKTVGEQTVGIFVSMWWRGPHHIDLGNLGNLRKLKKVEQTVSFHAKTETRNRKFAKREEILGGSWARIWPGPGTIAKMANLKSASKKCAKCPAHFSVHPFQRYLYNSLSGIFL